MVGSIAQMLKNRDAKYLPITISKMERGLLLNRSKVPSANSPESNFMVRAGMRNRSRYGDISKKIFKSAYPLSNNEVSGNNQSNRLVRIKYMAMTV